MAPRTLNAILGFWLFLSGFLWKHDPVQLWNAWVGGTAAVTMAVLGLAGVRWCRYVHAAIGAWLILSAILGRVGSHATLWNHIIVGFGMVILGVSTSWHDLRRSA